jgi:mono/diheme cytochrome c family protein
MKSLALGIAVGLLTAGIVASARQEMSRSVREGVYTIVQADKGKAVYVEKCQSCHGTMATATPDMAPLLNDYAFQETWKDRSVGQFFDRIRRTMPQNEPATLSPEVTAEIVAYILSANKLPAGEAALPSDVELLREIRLDAEAP